MPTRRPAAETTPPPGTRTRGAIAKHTDTLVTVGISLAIFGAAYVVRILPQLNSIDSQIEVIHGQLGAVNDSLSRIGDSELLRLQLSALGLQQRLDALDQDAAATDAELQVGTSDAEALRRKVTELRAGADELGRALSVASEHLAPDAGGFPDVRGAAQNLSAQLEEARALLAPDGKSFPQLYEDATALARVLKEAEQRANGIPDVHEKATALAQELDRSREMLASANEQLAAVHGEAAAMAQKLALARNADAVVPCSEISDRKVLATLRRKGFCGK